MIGLGLWPREAYVPVLKELEGVEVCAVAARSAATQEYARQQFGQSVALHPDYRDLLADPGVEAVTLAVPNPIHAEVMEAAVASGKHLFYEPPIAHSPEAVAGLLARMAAAERVIQPDFELRYLPVVRAMREQLEAGTIGRPLMASIRLWCNWGFGGGRWNYNPEQEGFFPWLGCWYLDVLDCAMAAAPQRATVTGGHAANGRLMDHGWCSLEYAGGGIGRFEFNLVAVDGLEINVSVLGTGGEAELDLVRGTLRWRGADRAWHERSHPAAQPACGFVGMRECLSGFIEAVRSGRAPEAGLEVARRVHAAMLACATAEESRVTVDVRPALLTARHQSS
jgi:predicted dehydrogenase